MRFRTLEIRWHDSKPISSCDFQPLPFKKARPPNLGSSDIGTQEWTERWAGQTYKLATAGEDNHVRIWMVHPNIRPTTSASEDSTPAQTAPRPPRVEYLATLSRHSAAVNVVRWSPNGELLASAGDDGMLIIWAQSSTPQASTYGSDLSPEEISNEKEFWKVRIMVRCTAMQVYDLAWSPTGEYIIAGSTDNAARVFQAADGKCLHELVDHTHFVQGVSWDPLNEFIATQSSDRAMHVHRVSHNNQGGGLEVHAVGKNTHMRLNLPGSSNQSGRNSKRHGRTSSVVSNASHTDGGRENSRPRMPRRESMTSESNENVFEESGSALFSSSTSSQSGEPKESKDFRDPAPLSLSLPLTPSTSVASTPVLPGATSGLPSAPTPHLSAISTSSTASSSSMFPPPVTPIEKEKSGQSSSRRSSISGASNTGAPVSPAPSAFSRYGRSPSPMPALPAIRTALPTSYSYPTHGSGQWRGSDQWRNIGLYGDESFTNFFRRLTFSPDGALLVTPAGQFEDPEVVVMPTPSSEEGSTTPARGRKGRIDGSPVVGTGSNKPGPSSCVHIYTRANFASPPIATLPGHKKASVAVSFSPILVDLREGTAKPEEGATDGAPKRAVLGTDLAEMNVDVLGPLPSSSSHPVQGTEMGMTLLHGSHKTSSSSQTVVAPTPRRPGSSEGGARPPTPVASKPSSPIPHSTPTPSASAVISNTGSVFALPYRMLFAVVTMDAIVIYDTQQTTPVCMLTKLHYDEFTDASWSPDGQTLILSSRDGYCTLIIFDEIFPAHHTQQQALQLQSIAHQHSVPITPAPTSSQHSHGHAGPSSRAVTPSATPVFGNVGLPTSTPSGMPSMPTSSSKRHSSASGSEHTSTPVQDAEMSSSSAQSAKAPGEPLKRIREEDAQHDESSANKAAEPAKKKRRVALTRVGDLGA
ncbi:WD40 repeat-like protein [Dendrothele bispora CBS 962.96]|uniref:WD40 repeat-like protein n=1 Tax=Dendrothele bispora (strain CBS 962.96) TaxID=1314807 RepID=A0A4V4HI72_DENBC|nr:WD40 repeat-like protein [Dendrothele bispora CBS 962.96]